MKKAQLMNTRWFHTVDPAELDSFDEWAKWLEALLHNPCSIWEEDGELVLLECKQLVERLNGLRIEIYPNEHAPPHFHVKSPNVDASFTIDECKLLKGAISGGDVKKIRYFHSRWWVHGHLTSASTQPGRKER